MEILLGLKKLITTDPLARNALFTVGAAIVGALIVVARLRYKHREERKREREKRLADACTDLIQKASTYAFEITRFGLDAHRKERLDEEFQWAYEGLKPNLPPEVIEAGDVFSFWAGIRYPNKSTLKELIEAISERARPYLDPKAKSNKAASKAPKDSEPPQSSSSGHGGS